MYCEVNIFKSADDDANQPPATAVYGHTFDDQDACPIVIEVTAGSLVHSGSFVSTRQAFSIDNATRLIDHLAAAIDTVEQSRERSQNAEVDLSDEA